jgi:hypothetical protein
MCASDPQDVSAIFGERARHRGLKEIGYFEGVSDFAAVCPRQLAVQSASAVRQPFGTAYGMSLLSGCSWLMLHAINA